MAEALTNELLVPMDLVLPHLDASNGRVMDAFSSGADLLAADGPEPAMMLSCAELPVITINAHAGGRTLIIHILCRCKAVLRQRARHRVMRMLWNATFVAVCLHDIGSALLCATAALSVVVHDGHEVALLGHTCGLGALAGSFTELPATMTGLASSGWFPRRVNAGVAQGPIGGGALRIIAALANLVARHRHVCEDLNIAFHVQVRDRRLIVISISVRHAIFIADYALLDGGLNLVLVAFFVMRYVQIYEELLLIFAW